jgi:hypothetical protein
MSAEYRARRILQILLGVVTNGFYYGFLVRAGFIARQSTGHPAPALGIGGDLCGVVAEGSHWDAGLYDGLLAYGLGLPGPAAHALNIR